MFRKHEKEENKGIYNLPELHNYSKYRAQSTVYSVLTKAELKLN